MSKYLSETIYIHTLCVCERERAVGKLWQDYAYPQARPSLRCLPIRQVPKFHVLIDKCARI